jgi:membrane protein implicated in regulation of membrane protease activity
MNPMAIMWLVLLILFLVAEGATAAVTTIWFAAGALASMIATLLGAEIWLQVILFVVVSIGCLLALRPLLKKYITPKKVRTNVDAVVGRQGVVLEKIDNLASTGRVKLGGMEWTARAENNECIEAGTVVRVERIEGVKVYVTPVAVPAK